MTSMSGAGPFCSPPDGIDIGAPSTTATRSHPFVSAGLVDALVAGGADAGWDRLGEHRRHRGGGRPAHTGLLEAGIPSSSI